MSVVKRARMKFTEDEWREPSASRLLGRYFVSQMLSPRVQIDNEPDPRQRDPYRHIAMR